MFSQLGHYITRVTSGASHARGVRVAPDLQVLSEKTVLTLISRRSAINFAELTPLAAKSSFRRISRPQHKPIENTVGESPRKTDSNKYGRNYI